MNTGPAVWRRSKDDWLQVGIQSDTKDESEGRQAQGRMRAKVLQQKNGIDFNETFVPAAKLSSLRLLLAFAFFHSLFIHQVDPKNFIRNGKAEEEI